MSDILRWETPHRFYLAMVQQDLFGEWEVLRCWGAKGSRLGNHMREPAYSKDHAHALLQRVVEQRFARGYTEVERPYV